ncbi:MAG: hypothetical protein HS132_13370 [Planctomycetia bacterium]|nr:hypothetical protein [Planctomycetia bacterium]
MVSGLAPGGLALTRSVGKSTLGRSLTGRSLYPATPKKSFRCSFDKDYDKFSDGRVSIRKPVFFQQ